jgi:hypothetical protein
VLERYKFPVPDRDKAQASLFKFEEGAFKTKEVVYTTASDLLYRTLCERVDDLERLGFKSAYILLGDVEYGLLVAYASKDVGRAILPTHFMGIPVVVAPTSYCDVVPAPDEAFLYEPWRKMIKSKGV